MKKGNFLQWLVFPLCLIYTQAYCSDLLAVDEVSNYVVIGAFKFEENAKEWTVFAQSHNLDAQYRMNYDRGLYYVYVFSSDDVQEAVSKLHEVWELGYFEDAWLYTGDFGTEPLAEAPEADPMINLTEEVEETYLNQGREEAAPKEEVEGISEEEISPVLVGDSVQPSLTKEQLRHEVLVEDDTSSAEDQQGSLGDYLVFFNLFNAANSADVTGEVQVIDTERAKLLQTVKSGEYVNILNPNNGTGRLSLIVETFGYRKAQHEINFDTPLADTSSLDIDLLADVMVYHFPLIRYHKGDIATMYNVYFFKDAAIMRPESKFEVNSLLQMMKENPNYKIRIHGHVNGKNPGRIITAGDDKAWFSLTDDDESGFGSAKKLSKERALVIKEYLVEKGIDADRMEIKAWGGRRMLYDKHSSQAYKNIRVEIEILEE